LLLLRLQIDENANRTTLLEKMLCQMKQAFSDK